MKSLVVLIFIGMMSISYGYSKIEILRDYQNKNYQKVCSLWAELIVSNEKDENIFTAVGDACVKEDAINSLCNVVKHLIRTKEHRESASYFATLVLEKKLIYQFMLDGIHLQDLRLPKTDHILSRVFDELAQGNYTLDKEKKVIINTPSMNYILWLGGQKPQKMYIDEMKDTKLIKRHWYL